MSSKPTLGEAVAKAQAKRKMPQRPLMDEIIEKLPKDEADDLLNYFFDEDVSSEVLTDALKSMGYKISPTSLKAYRRKFTKLVDALGDS